MILPGRGILALSGEDRLPFLQGLVTNDVGLAPAYACLLTAQGRYLHDFFVVPDGDRLLIDCEAARREDLMVRLKRFRLRAKVEIMDVTASYQVHSQSRESGNLGEFIDPRHPDLGYRVITDLNLSSSAVDDDWKEYDRKRILLGVPDGSRDMVPEEALLLENNIDRLNGIAWDKGCYVGQELTARMHFKGGVKKRLTPVGIEGIPPDAGSVIFSGGVEIGEMRSSCDDVGLALLRVDASGELVCEGSSLTVIASPRLREGGLRSNPD